MEYTAVIRTLGTAGEKYQCLLNSLRAQSVPPRAIIVYIAEGYPLPQETIGTERYVYVKKGMMAQRALPYTEVNTEWILFCDDDIYLESSAVAQMYALLEARGADVISPDVFHNSEKPFATELLMTLSGRMRARRGDKHWGYKVMRTAGYSYNKRPAEVMVSQTNAGPCFFCRKQHFLSINLQDEMWIDSLSYPLGEDQVMFYKMYRQGLKVLTWYTDKVVHLDAGEHYQPEKAKALVYADLRFKVIFWHRFIYSPERQLLPSVWNVACMGYVLAFTLLVSLVRGQFNVLNSKYKALKDAIGFLKSAEYKALPSIR